MADSLAQLYKNQHTQSRSRDRQKPRRSIVRGLLLIAGLVLLGQIVYFGYFSPRLTINKVVMNGLYGISQDEILGSAGLYPGIMFHQVSIPAMRQSLLQIPEIKDVQIEKTFPSTLMMSFELREPLAAMYVEGQKYMVDKEGVLFLPKDATGFGGPILTGLPWEPWGQVSRVPYQYRLFLEDLDKIRLTEPGVFRLFSQFVFESNGLGSFSVYLYPTHIVQKVRIGNRMTSEQAVMLLRVLEMLRTRPDFALIEDIDFRTGDVIYTKVGGDS